MFRKIFCLCLSLIDGIQHVIKALLFLMLSILSFFCTFTYFPFVLKKTNLMEYRSNNSLVILAFSSLFYVLNVNEYLIWFWFLMMALANIRFLCYAFFELLKIFYQSHLKNILKKYPIISKTFQKVFGDNER